MEFARKMILIPQESLEKVRQNSLVKEPQTVQTPGTPASRLDAEMYKILNSKADDYAKSEMYQQVLQKFLNLKNLSAEAVLPRGGKEIPPVDKVETGNIDKKIMDGIPKGLRDKAENVIHWLRQSGNITWNELGNISVDGVEARGANIIDLVNEAVRSRRTARPRAYDQFVRILRKASIPREFVGNKSLWGKVLDTSSSSSSTSAAQTAVEADTDNTLANFPDTLRGTTDEEEEEEAARVNTNKKKRSRDILRLQNSTANQSSILVDTKRPRIQPATLNHMEWSHCENLN